MTENCVDKTVPASDHNFYGCRWFRGTIAAKQRKKKRLLNFSVDDVILEVYFKKMRECVREREKHNARKRRNEANMLRSAIVSLDSFDEVNMTITIFVYVRPSR